MSHKPPAAATRCGGLETIVEKDDGLLVPTRDPDALADAMRRVRAGVAAFDRAEMHRRSVARFGEQAVVPQLAAEYRKALARSPQGAPR
jgi:glycosyltransferase involved in cell wall biosynthesis